MDNTPSPRDRVAVTLTRAQWDILATTAAQVADPKGAYARVAVGEATELLREASDEINRVVHEN